MSSHRSAVVTLHHFYSEHITEKWRFGDICRRVSHDLNIHYLLRRHAVSEMAESVKEISTALRPIPVLKRCSLAWGGLLEGKWVNNCWWGWQNRRDLGKCTHQCDETQGNNSVQALSTKNVFFSSFLSVLFFASSFLLLSVCLLAPEDENLPKALVHYCFLVFRRIGEYISLGLVYVLQVLNGKVHPVCWYYVCCAFPNAVGNWVSFTDRATPKTGQWAKLQCSAAPPKYPHNAAEAWTIVTKTGPHDTQSIPTSCCTRQLRG